MYVLLRRIPRSLLCISSSATNSRVDRDRCRGWPLPSSIHPPHKSCESEGTPLRSTPAQHPEHGGARSVFAFLFLTVFNSCVIPCGVVCWWSNFSRIGYLQDSLIPSSCAGITRSHFFFRFSLKRLKLFKVAFSTEFMKLEWENPCLFSASILPYWLLEPEDHSRLRSFHSPLFRFCFSFHCAESIICRYHLISKLLNWLAPWQG